MIGSDNLADFYVHAAFCNYTMERFAIVQWEDKLSSIINLNKVKFPKKPVSDYKEGDYVVAFYGTKAYKTRLSEISDTLTIPRINDENKVYLHSQRTKDGHYPLQYTFEIEDSDNRKETDAGVTRSEKQSATEDTLSAKQSATEGTLSAKSAAAEDTISAKQSATEGPLSDKQYATEGTLSAKKSSATEDTLSDKQPSDQLSVIEVVSEKTKTFSSHSSSSPSGYSHSSKRKIEHLEKDMRELKKRIQILEAKATEATSSEAHLEVNNVENALKCMEHIPETDINSVIRTAVFQNFTKEELVTCNRKGKKTQLAGNGPVKPALDEKKMFFVEQVVCKKCKTITKDIFNKKFDNILKTVRRKKPDKK